MRKLIISIACFTLAPLLLFVSIVSLCYFTYQKNQSKLLTLNFEPSQKIAYAALPTTYDMIQEEISQKDARIDVLKKFFSQYKSPLEPYAQNVVSTADSYGLDYRLIPAIAMQESNLCKKAPEQSYNCWGFGIYGKKIIRFKSYEEAIQAVTKTLAKDYKQNGLETPDEIMKKYTPSSNGSWANSVNFFMNKLQITP